MIRYNFPTTIFCADGLMNRLGDVPPIKAGEFPGPALLVTDEGLMNTGIPERVAASLKSAGVPCEIYSNVRTNPDDVEVDEGVEAYRKAGAKTIIGLGGGSPVDVAKTIAVRLNHDGPMEKYDDLLGGDALITGEIPPIIAIPTTAGTGAEVSRSSVIHIRSVDRKVVIFTPRMMPAIALMDAELTTGLPARVTAWTGIDALTHLLEAFVAKGDHPMADGIALEGINMVFKALPRAYKDGNDIEARRAMLIASMMGAVAFQKGLGTAHSMAHPLSSVCGLHHGQANALVLFRVTEYNRAEIGEERFKKLSFAAAPDKTPSYDTFMSELRQLLEFCDIPDNLSEAGVKKEQVDELSELAIQDGCHGGNPRTMTVEGFKELFHAHLA